MAFLKIDNVAIRGISACAPANIEENKDLPVFEEGEAERVINQTGISRKHVVALGTTSLDLCKSAIEKLLEDLKWEKETIDVIVFVSTTFDHILPPNACILQGMLGFSEETLCLDLRQGCPGWTQGLTSMCSLISHGSMKRGILLVGDTPTLSHSPLDKETRPLFGDAGTATALEFDLGAKPIEFYHGTRGKDYKSIYAKNGGFRYTMDEEALKYVEYGANIKYRGIDVVMDGMSVFGFGLSMGPKSVDSLCEHFGVDKDKVDYFLFHQANKYMNDKIRKKLKIDESKVPYSMQNFGNTSCASIPLTLVSQCNEEYATRKLNSVACSFGVGLAWGCVHFETDHIICPELILI
jgi:3-oxoacyl-[acyl-carrier-protein] synthase-3